MSAQNSDFPGRHDPLFRDNLPARYDVLLAALRDIKNMRGSAFRSYQEDRDDMRRIAINALRDAGEQP